MWSRPTSSPCQSTAERVECGALSRASVRSAEYDQQSAQLVTACKQG